MSKAVENKIEQMDVLYLVIVSDHRERNSFHKNEDREFYQHENFVRYIFSLNVCFAQSLLYHQEYVLIE